MGELVRKLIGWSIIGGAILMIIVGFSLRAHAAEFTTQYIEKDKSAVVNLDGSIGLGDPKKMFEQIKAAMDRGYKVKALRLNSTGGILGGGMTIAHMLHGSGIETYVNRGKQCYSSCFVAFLGGQHRFAARNAKIGMHSLYDPDLASKTDGRPVENQESLADTVLLVRWMKEELGISDYIVGTIVTTPPDSVHTYTPEELNLLGVELF